MVRNIHLALFIVFLFSVFSINITIADDSLDIGSIYFLKLTQEEGLSHNNIECIFKDSDGFMWFGTRNGLCRYDGTDIKIYRSSANTNSLSGDRILSVTEDKIGMLWIGTYANGLNKFDKRTESFKQYTLNNSTSERINRIKVFKDGTVWVCTSNGLAKYMPEADSFKVYKNDPQNPKSLSSNVVYDITETRNGAVYVADESDAIQQLNTKTNEFNNIYYKRSPELNTNYRKRIVEDKNGVLWIAANVHGLCSYNPANGESTIIVKGNGQLSTNILTGDMAIDQYSNLWVCTDGGGINILNTQTGKFQYLRKNESKEGSLTSDHIYTVYFDEFNTIWVGTFAEGINIYDPSRHKFNSYLFSPGDLTFCSGKSVISAFQDSKKRIWIGTDGQGLFMIDEKGILHSYYHQPNNTNSLTTNVITSINEDKSGNILIGTYSGGLLSFTVEKGKFKLITETDNIGNKISSSNVWRIFPDSKNRIWLGILGTGVDLYNPNRNTFENYGPNSPRADKVNFPNVMAILEDSDGDIWFGTEGKGLFILDNETNKIYRIAPDSAKNVFTQGVIKCIFQDRFGVLWIGTEGDGLYKIDKKTSKTNHYTIDNGLSNNIVQSILEDELSNLWIGTSNGLSVFDPNTEKFRNYIEEDGLSGNEFNQNVLIQLADGRFLAGTTKGLDVFRPQDIIINQNLPRVILTNLEVLNKEVLPGVEINKRLILDKSITYTNSITLTYKEKILSLGFVALNYTLPKKCQYKYILEGFDDTWYTTTTNRRIVSYSNLKPGNYKFKVKASNNDGKWGNNERVLIIRILPPFYETWWFRAIIALIAAFIIILIYSYRLNLHKNQFLQKQMEQESRIMHLENEKLESELQKLTFHVLNRNRALIDQKNRLIGLSMKAREVVRIGLQDIIGKIDEELNDDKDWIYMEPQLDKVYNNFVSKLKEKHSDLTISEVKIAAYVRMNLSTKEISEFMHKTTRAVENDRYRLRKKIGLDSNDSLQTYLVDL